MYDDYPAAEAVLRMPAVAERAWLDRLERGPFLAAFTLFTAVGS